MEPETKNCQNCKQNFTIEPEDFMFYEKVRVPPPTFCPECRMQRRFAWRNERTLHHTTCAGTGKPIISGFRPDTGYVVYERDYWWSDNWDQLASGMDYDFSKPFFAQFDELMHRAPHPAVFNGRTVNCAYTQHTGEFKNGYLVSASWDGEDVMYSSRCNETKDSMDNFVIFGSELCYEDVSCVKCSKVYFSQKSESCVDSWFMFNCKGCTSCFGCTNLRNKSYYIFNEPYSREEYLQKLSELRPSSWSSLQQIKARVAEIRNRSINNYAQIINSPDCTGDSLSNVSRCKECFGIIEKVQDCKYLQNGGWNMFDSYDGYGVGATAELLYEMFDSGVQGSRQMFGGIVYGGNNLTYGYNLTNCNDCFGCVGLRKQQYCILNKQYSKEEYETLVPKIKEQMSTLPYQGKDGCSYGYGEFFPSETSPFGYNETIANDYFPLTKEGAEARGYKWYEIEKPKHVPTIKAERLPDDIAFLGPEITKEIIECMTCGRPYRILEKEFAFLKSAGIPLPRNCFECRHLARFRQIDFPKLYARQCQCAGAASANGMYSNTANHPHGEASCTNTFQTTVAPDRPETVYCEKCYNAEVV